MRGGVGRRALIVMVLGAALVYLLGLDREGVRIAGELPRNLPPLASFPFFDLNLISELSLGSLAIGAIGLVETTSIARSISARSGQRLDSNQEFVGQGLASFASGLFSGYATSASFNRSAASYDANAQTGMAAAFSGESFFNSPTFSSESLLLTSVSSSEESRSNGGGGDD